MARTKLVACKSCGGKDPARRELQTEAARRMAPRPKGVAVPKKRARNGMKALQEIRQHQKTTHLLIRKAPFQRLVREILQEVTPAGSNYRLQSVALLALQEAAEHHLTGVFDDSQLLAIHAKRITIFPRDMKLAMRIRREDS